MSDNQAFYTPSQVSKALKIPRSTLRRYSDLYAHHLSSSAQVSGRKRRYSERDMRILSEIRNLYGKRLSQTEINTTLNIFDPSAPIPDDPKLDLIPAIRVQAMIETVETGVRDIQHQQSAQDQRITALEDWLRLPWWKRLFTRRPPF